MIELLSTPIWQRMGLTLLHFFWQGLTVAILFILTVRLLKLKRGNQQYAASLAAFALMLTLPLATFCILDTSQSPAVTQPELITQAPADIIELEPLTDETANWTSQPSDWPAEINYQPDNTIAELPIVPLTLPAEPELSTKEQALAYLHAALPWCIAAWLAGVLVLSAHLLMGFIGVHRWRQCLIPLPRELNSTIQRLAQQLGLRPTARVAISARATQAVAVGYFRPMVLLPVAMITQMPTEMLQAVIAHELAHIRRFDIWVNLIQRIAETLLFYHPAVWWLSNHMRTERELCCDELAIRATGQRLTYASTLERAGQIILAARQPALSVGLGQDQKPTLHRVRHILGLKPTPQRSRFWIAGLLAIAIAAAILLPMLNTQKDAIADEVIEQQEEPQQDDPNNPEFKVELPNGVTVELLGVCENPSQGQQWWRPNGTLLQQAPYDNHSFRRTFLGQEREFAIRLTNLPTEPIDYRWSFGEAGIPSDVGIFPDFHGEQVGDIWARAAQFDPALETTIIHFGVAAAQWTTQVSFDGQGAGQYAHGEYEFLCSGARVQDDLTCVTVSHTMLAFARRTIAVDNNGVIHYANYLSEGAIDGVRQTTFGFRDLPIENIREFQFQTRPFEWVQFDNVALRSDCATDVQNETEVEDAAAGAEWYEQSPITQAAQTTYSEQSTIEIALEDLRTANREYESGHTVMLHRFYRHLQHPTADGKNYNLEELWFDGEEIRRDFIRLSDEQAEQVRIQGHQAIGEFTHSWSWNAENGNHISRQALTNPDGQVQHLAWISNQSHVYYPEFARIAYNGFDPLRQFLDFLTGNENLTLEQYAGTDGTVLMKFYVGSDLYLDIVVDPAKDLAIVSMRRFMQGRIVQEIFNENYVQLANGDWYPLKHTDRQYRNNYGEAELFRVDVFETLPDNVEFDIDIDPEVLLPPFEAGTEISDATVSPIRTHIAEPFTATLSNGINVELLGVCENPSQGHQWWQPDGTSLQQAPYYEMYSHLYQSQKRELAIRLTNLPADPIDYHWSIAGVSGTFGGGHPTGFYGEQVQDIWAVAAGLDNPLETTTVRFGIAAGQWTTQASSQGQSHISMGTDQGANTFNFANPYVQDGTTYITVSDNMLAFPCRLIAIDNDGIVHYTTSSSGGSAGNTRQKTYAFNNLPLENIQEFQFQTREYEWVQFDNVALNPGTTTNVQASLISEQNINSAPQPTATNTNRGPIAYWDFNGNAQDRIGNNHGIVHDAVLTDGVSGQAYSLDGDGDCIEIPCSEVFDFGAGDVSISAWFKAEPSADGCLISLSQADYSPKIAIEVNSSLATYAEPGWASVEYRAAGVTDGKWYHAVVTIENGVENGYKLYLDGMAVGRGTYVGRLQDWDNITIGSYRADNDQSFQGSIDEVAIYDRALSPDEVLAIYTSIMEPTPTTQPTTAITAEQVLAAYEQAVYQMRSRVAFDAQATMVFDGDYNWPVAPKQRDIEVHVRRDTDRLDTIRTEEFSYAAPPPDGIREEQRGGPVTWRRILKNETGFSYRQWAEDSPQDLWVEIEDPNHVASIIYSEDYQGRFLDGYTPGRVHFIPTAMRQGGLHLRDQMELIDGHATYVLEANNADGQWILWVDPQCNYLPRRIVIRRNAQSMYDQETLRRGRQPVHPGGYSKGPEALILTDEERIDSIEIQNIDGRFFPTAAICTNSTAYMNGQSTQSVAHYRRSNINFNPDFEAMGAFVVEVPNGTEVIYAHEMNSPTRYQWIDGEIVTVHEEEVEVPYVTGCGNICDTPPAPRTFHDTVSGRVLTAPGGTGVPNATVKMWTYFDTIMTTETAQDGSYSFTDLVPDELDYVLTVEKTTPGIWNDWVMINLFDTNADNPQLYMTLPQSISGTVRDQETHNPVAGAIIQVSTSDGNTDYVETDAAGQYILYVEPRSVTVTCAGIDDRYYSDQSNASVTIDLAAGENITDIDFEVTGAPQNTPQSATTSQNPTEVNDTTVSPIQTYIAEAETPHPASRAGRARHP
ncbi:MAG: carboxypeptidase regulatory-like domain-containing protein [Sedimentisphaerales bacterium]|nr:carboxypeptidase regulatory-like domain-containing protein [Sedimentisphaerales bacterium]